MEWKKFWDIFSEKTKDERFLVLTKHGFITTAIFYDSEFVNEHSFQEIFDVTHFINVEEILLPNL